MENQIKKLHRNKRKYCCCKGTFKQIFITVINNETRSKYIKIIDTKVILKISTKFISTVNKNLYIFYLIAVRIYDLQKRAP